MKKRTGRKRYIIPCYYTLGGFIGLLFLFSFTILFFIQHSAVGKSMTVRVSTKLNQKSGTRTEAAYNDWSPIYGKINRETDRILLTPMVHSKWPIDPICMFWGYGREQAHYYNDIIINTMSCTELRATSPPFICIFLGMYGDNHNSQSNPRRRK